MGAARAAGRDAAAPAPPRRAYTAPLAPRAPINIRGNSHSSRNHGAADTEDPRTIAATAAAEAASAAADFSTSPTSDVSSVTGSAVGAYVPPSANGEAVETLYSHPAAKILSFTAGGPRNLDNIGSSASRGAAGRSRRSLTNTDDEITPGTLPWSSQFDRTIAVGALSIYRAPGSVAFLSCGSALQPILPKSQCWCIDEESSKFILQIRRPQYWRIEVPVGDGGENDERAHRLREVLDNILQFEKTPCPFKRTFTVELPEQPSTPLKKKPWTPVRRPESETSPAGSALPKLQTSQHKQHRRLSSTPALPEEDEHDHESMSPISPPQQQQQQQQHPATTQPGEFTRKEWLAMLESQKKGAGGVEDVDEFGRKLVPALVAEHEQRIMDLKASEIEINKMGSPYRNNGSFSSPSGPQQGGNTRRDRTMSLNSENAAAVPSAWPSIDGRWLEESDRSTTADSNSPFNSLRSWLSSTGNKTVTSAPSPPSSTADSLPDVPPSLSSLYEDARRIFNNGSSPFEQQPQQQTPPRIRHRATTSSISMSNHPNLPPAVNIIAPSHLRNLHSSGRATTRLEAMKRIPGSIISRVFEIMLAPPNYLLTLMLRIAARILKGEWRGFAVGKNTDTGENIPVQWDYTDVDDPLGHSTELTRPDDTKDVGRLSVYTEADVEVYTDNEDNDFDDDDDEVDTARCFSSPSSPKSSSTAKPRSIADSSDSDGDGDTLSDTGGDPIVWTRRWNVD